MNNYKIYADTQFSQKAKPLRSGLRGCGGAWQRYSSLNRMAIRRRRALLCTTTTTHSTPFNYRF